MQNIKNMFSARLTTWTTVAFTSLTVFSATSILTGCTTTSASEKTVSKVPTGPTLYEPLDAKKETLQVNLDGITGEYMTKTHVFEGFGCTGQNRSPAIRWSNAPAETKSFAIVMHDPDAPTGVGFFHWSVFNLQPSVAALAEGASGTSASNLPPGVVEGYTDFGKTGYGGPCPPAGSPHRYVFTVYALDVPQLGVGGNATGAFLRFMLAQHTLAYGRATALYEQMPAASEK